MGKYAAIAASAAALIARKGGPVTVRRVAEGTFDPITQTTLGGAVRTASLRAVVVAGGRGEDYEPGTLLRAASIRLFFALRGADLEPQPGDQITWRGAKYTITRASTVDPAGDGAVISECEAS